MTFITELNLLIKARYNIIYIFTFEEERLEYSIRKAVDLIGINLVYTWDFVDGYSISLNKTKFASKNPLQALEFIENYSVDNPTTFI